MNVFAPITDLFIQALNFFTTFFDGSIGLSIIAVTLLVKFIMLPLMIPAYKSQREMRKVQPELNKLKKKYKDNKEELAKQQMKLFQDRGINPLSGCLPQLVQAVLLIVFFNVIRTSFNGDGTLVGNAQFLWLDLSQTDSLYVLPVLVGVSQLILSLMIKPETTVDDKKKKASKTVSTKDDVEAMDAEYMQTQFMSQALLFMPLLSVVFTATNPSGLGVYWVTSTIFSTIQQYFITGLGGLKPHLQRFGIIK